MLKTPEFWTKKTFVSWILSPFSLAYLLVFYILRIFCKKEKVSKPIICIGNLIAGGSGKTPTAIALGKILKEMGVNFAYLSRGFMGDKSNFLMLRKDENHKAEQVGDEPLLLLETAPTFVSKNRLFGAKQIEKMNKFDLIVLDDGMQNNRLDFDFGILVIDGKIGFGNGLPIPAGPMREAVFSGLKKADLVIVVGEINDDLRKKIRGKKVFNAKIMPKNLEKFYGKKLFAFCGLAYPQKFFELLKANDLNVVKTLPFPDHYNYKKHDLEAIIFAAEKENLMAVATKKDWVKFPKEFQKRIAFLDIELEFEDVNLIKNELKNFYEFYFKKAD